MTETLLQVQSLSKHFLGKGAPVRAVEEVHFSLQRGETLGLVGESGCGKTTLGRTLLRLYEPTAGKIVFEDAVLYDSTRKKQPDMRPYRRRMQMIFQDPAAALDPRMTVGESIGQALDIHKLCRTSSERRDRIAQALELVGLRAGQCDVYPHAFSGGMQQRIVIARALVLQPAFLVCDEPVSALDVSIQSQIINMLAEMQQELGLTYLFIGHDLSVVRHISDRIGVMYLGRLVELADSETITAQPLHPYTQSLLSAVPIPEPGKGRNRPRLLLHGELPSPASPPSGCSFRTRCPRATAQCAAERPHLRETAPGHCVACHQVELRGASHAVSLKTEGNSVCNN